MMLIAVQMGEHYNLRTLSNTDIIAFNDPNDILSYTITKEFMDRYLDSRLCIGTTNININVADVTRGIWLRLCQSR